MSTWWLVQNKWRNYECTSGLLACVHVSQYILEFSLVCVYEKFFALKFSGVGVFGEEKISICYRIVFFSPFFSLTNGISLLSLLPNTPTSLGWIKSEIKTSILVSMWELRHINSTKDKQSCNPIYSFFSPVCSALFIVVYI